MGLVHLAYLNGSRFYICKHCKAHLAYSDDIASMGLHTAKGEAFLFHDVVNVFMRGKEDRQIETIMYTVSDIYCVQCGNLVGWKYEHTEDVRESYKIGKFLIERIHMLDPAGNEYVGDNYDTDEEATDSDDDLIILV